MKKLTKAPLKLNRETVASLHQIDLKAVAGGHPNPTRSCHNTCIPPRYSDDYC